MERAPGEASAGIWVNPGGLGGVWRHLCGFTVGIWAIQGGAELCSSARGVPARDWKLSWEFGASGRRGEILELQFCGSRYWIWAPLGGTKEFWRALVLEMQLAFGYIWAVWRVVGPLLCCKLEWELGKSGRFGGILEGKGSAK